MKLFKVDGAVLLQASSALYRLENQNWDALVNQENLYDFLEVYASTHAPIETTIDGEKIEAPIGSQENMGSRCDVFAQQRGKDG